MTHEASAARPYRSVSAAALLPAFERDGFVVVRELFEPDEITLIREVSETDPVIERNTYSRTSADRESAADVAIWNHPTDTLLGLAARCERVAGTMEVLLGGEVYHYHSKLTTKAAYTGGSWEWHQDYAYWYHNGCLFPWMANCFIAVDRATRANGCLEVIAGSHHLGRIDHVRVRDGKRVDTSVEDLAKNADSVVAADPERVAMALTRLDSYFCELERGDAVFFHGNLLHRSGRNESSERRRALICCYNTARNDPIVAHHHPRYTPLIKVSDAAIRDGGPRYANGLEGFLSHPGRAAQDA